MSPNNSNGGSTGVKKQHFGDIYVEPTPVPFKVRILDALDYVSDDFNRQVFDSHILPWARERSSSSTASTATPLNFVDLCSCFGNTTMATVHGMTYDEIRDNWSDESRCRTIDAPRRIPNLNVMGIDISEPALSYGRDVGLYDDFICGDLNDRSSPQFDSVVKVMSSADILLSTAALHQLDLGAIEEIVSAFASGKGEGYALVNFLNPFAIEKADDTKRILLKHLDFVGSRATRHRRMSELEMRNYPGEEWSLLEIWVLKRRVAT